ncbi:MAG: DUF4145 domain-containing protein [Pseudomonadota bacterium]
MKYFPPTKKREVPIWVSESLSSSHPGLFDLIVRLYDLFDLGHNVFVGMGVRTCFDYTADSLKIDSGLSFKDKIEALRKAGHISAREKALLESLVDIGSAAIHRSWTPNDEDISVMLDALEGFIHRSIILPEGLDDIVKKIPRRGS